MYTVTHTFSVRKQIIAAFVFTCLLKSVHLKQCSGKFTLNKKHFGQRLVGFNISTLAEESIGTCVNKCFQLTHCLSTNFDSISKQCDLNNITADEMPTAIVNSGMSILSDLSAWPKSMVASCGDKPCNGRDICLPAGNTFLCHNSDCPKAPLFGKASSTGSPEIGGKMEYKCTNPLHRIIGQDYVQCGWMNTWSSNTEITCTAALKCSEGFKLYSSSCYLFDTASYTWDEAWTKCKDEYKGHLVHIDNHAENDWLASECQTYYTNIAYFWINLTDRSIEGKWIWNDTDTEAIYTNWGNNEQIGGDTENCVAITSIHNYQWADLGCGRPFSAICETEPFSDL